MSNMSWFAELADKAENILVNLDEQTGAALRNQNILRNQKRNTTISRKEPAHNTQVKQTTPQSSRNTKNPSIQPSTTQRPKNQNTPHRATRDVPMIKVARNSINGLPKTSVGKVDNESSDTYGFKPRRYSWPDDMRNMNRQTWIKKMESLGEQNALLKRELNVTNKEMKELLDRLHMTEEELHRKRQELQNTDTLVQNETFVKQVGLLKTEIVNLTNIEQCKYKEEIRKLQAEIAVLKERNKELDKLIKEYDNQNKEREIEKNLLQKELRHGQTTINLLQSDLSKSKEEFKRMENEWESYKIRVKSILAGKDKEIKELQQGGNRTEDTKILVEEIENLKKEREELSEVADQVRGECGDFKHYVETIEAKYASTERVVIALRQALKEEQVVRIKTEVTYNDLCKDLKCHQNEMEQTIASLRAALQDKDNELIKLKIMRDTTATSSVSESSAINVADFGAQDTDSEDKERLNHLTKRLMERQTQIDLLLADNSMLKIQLEKLEFQSKSKNQSVNGHSVVPVQSGVHRLRPVYNSVSWPGKMSRWMGTLVRSHPLFRLFVVMYMVFLHIWVFTVLLTSIPSAKGYYVPQIFNPN